MYNSKTGPLCFCSPTPSLSSPLHTHPLSSPPNTQPHYSQSTGKEQVCIVCVFHYIAPHQCVQSPGFPTTPHQCVQSPGSPTAPHQCVQSPGSPTAPHQCVQSPGSPMAPHQCVQSPGSPTAPHQCVQSLGSPTAPHQCVQSLVQSPGSGTSPTKPQVLSAVCGMSMYSVFNFMVSSTPSCTLNNTLYTTPLWPPLGPCGRVYIILCDVVLTCGQFCVSSLSSPLSLLPSLSPPLSPSPLSLLPSLPPLSLSSPLSPDVLS